MADALHAWGPHSPQGHVTCVTSTQEHPLPQPGTRSAQVPCQPCPHVLEGTSYTATPSGVETEAPRPGGQQAAHAHAHLHNHVCKCLHTCMQTHTCTHTCPNFS